MACMLLAALCAPALAVPGQVSLSPAEQAWLHAHPSITLALDQNNPPLNFRRNDAEGNSYAGVSIDYANLVAAKTGLTIRLVGATWEQALEQAMGHEVDGVLCARDRPERRASLAFSLPYLELPIALATRPGQPDIHTLAAMAGKRIAVVRDTARVPVLRARCPDCMLVEVDDPQQGLARIQAGLADAYFDDLPVVQRAIAASGARLKVALLYYYSEAATIRFGLRNDAPELLSIVNKGLAAITPAEQEQIHARWLSTASGAPVERELPLSAPQRAWLAAHPVIRVGVDATRAPIESVGEDGKPRGIAQEFLRRVEEMLGVRFELVPIRDPNDVLGLLARREVDMLSAMSQTDSRQRSMTLSDPFLTSPIVIFTAASAPPVSGLSGLNGKRVAVSTRAGVAEILPRDWPGIVPVTAISFKIALDLLHRDEVVAVVAPLLTGTHQLVELGTSDIRVSGETDYTYKVGFGVRSDWTELLPILNQALAAIPKSERDGFRQKWTVVRFDHETDYRPLGALLLAILIALAFIYQLRRMVKRRTAELQQEVMARRAREEEIQQLNAALELRVEQRTAELSQANEELRMAADQLVQTEKVASLGRLVAGIAHELNTPLGSTLTASSTLKAHLATFGQAALEGKLKRSSVDDFVTQSQLACEIIERNAHRAAGLIDNFKELAVDQASARRRLFPLRRTVEEVIASHHNAWKTTPHRIEVDIEETLQMDSFPGPLAQVLCNLLENTLVHGFAGKPAGHVQISARLQDERVDIQYADDGAGISAEHRGKIYDPFFTTRMGQGGSGLGLYIVQTMVTGVLGGNIAVQSSPGQGTTFQIVLPRSAPRLTENTVAGAHGMAPLPAG